MLTRIEIPQRRWIVLFVGGVAGLFAVIPHLGRHVGEFIAGTIVILVAAGVGTYLAPRAALTSPLLDSALGGRPFSRRALAFAPLALAVGIATTVVVIALNATLFAQPNTPSRSHPLWTGALYALSGGVSEEVAFHYGLLTALAWAMFRFLPMPASYWIAIGASALAFALFHLSGTAPVSPAPPGVTRTIVLGTIVGLTTGWLYWRGGLETAMLAHGVVSFAMHLTAPAVLG